MKKPSRAPEKESGLRPDSSRALRLLWTAQASEQLSWVAEYVAQDSPRAARAIVEQIERRLEQARFFPESGRSVPESPESGIREFIEGSYRLIYIVLAERVYVLSIVHSRRQLR